MQLRKSLLDLLSNSITRGGLMDFMNKEHTLENLLFYLDTEACNSTFSSELPSQSLYKRLWEASMEIYRLYLEPSTAPYEIFVEQKHRERIKKKIDIYLGTM